MARAGAILDAPAATPTRRLVTENYSNRRQRELIQGLRSLAAETAELRKRVRDRHAQAAREIDAWRVSEQERVRRHFESSLAKLRGQYADEKEQAIFQCESNGYRLYGEENREREAAQQSLDASLEEIRDRHEDARNKAEEQYAAIKDQPSQARAQFEAQCHPLAQRLQAAEAEAERILSRRKCQSEAAGDKPASPSPAGSASESLQRLSAAVAAAEEAVYDLRQQKAARFLEDGWPMLIFVFSAIALAWPGWKLLYPSIGWGFLAAVLVAAIAIALALRAVMQPIARRQTQNAAPAWKQARAAARGELAAALELAKASAEAKGRLLLEQKQQLLAASDANRQRGEAEAQTRLNSRLDRLAESYSRQRQELAALLDQQLQEADAKYPPQIERQQRAFANELTQVDEVHRKRLADNQALLETQERQIAERWRKGEQAFADFHRGLVRQCQQWFPPWSEISSAALRRAADGEGAGDGPSVVPFGAWTVPVPIAGDEQPPAAAVRAPAVLSHPDAPSLLLLAEGEGRQAAVAAMQTIMLRMLTAWPPGKVRFTIVDPVGLGQAFSAFMHLADFDEKLVANRIWTEPAHINQRLADLTEHMENVIQKYLRNEFASIQEYNEHAGEVAEPFQVLVAANFPAGFTDEAAARLVSIASSGARCGVFVLVSTDRKLRLPRNFDMGDLQSHAVTLSWESGQFRSLSPELADLPLTLDSPPDDRLFTEIVRSVGRAAKETHRVEVPFQRIAPPESEWWKADSRGGLEAPLGRAGATKLQYLRLGSGVSQHVLMAGKTGSGKSTLLHATIASLAIQYSPGEVQFYLIDFKKGVEFKAYAALGLPHARVIAIESEREFGLSVLERLDRELKERGDLFRRRGVQDIRGYRDLEPNAVLPRIVLVIDEFQEFFVSEDKIAQEAALLLDRLVRQGRAFGIHVLLGSQTLAGAYSLARSTLGQMAVRIALQCSETDAHLILSEDNTAARLLSRPGEAIYNDANGMLQGNHPFQVVWLPDHEREHIVRRLAEMADEAPRQERFGRPAPAIVFEGNAAADPRGNAALAAALDSGREGETAEAAAQLPTAWLGEPVSIKDPTAVRMLRQNGSNLLIVGPQEEQALGLLANSLIGLAATLPAEPLPERGLRRFLLLDGARPEASDAGFWSRLKGKLPIDLAVCAPGIGVAAAIAELAAEVERRLQSSGDSSPSLFLAIYNLARFRELQKADDFAFKSFDDASPPTGKQFHKILRDGPAVGVHALVWCDSYNALSRWIDRQTMHDFGQRVLFPMSAADSSNLMDSPAASRLGAHRAILYDKDSGAAEKFRPYAPPDSAWLERVAQALARRTTVAGAVAQATGG